MTGSRPPRMLICHDHMVDALLNRASEQFSAWGIEVVRGLPNPPGDITVYGAGSLELFENVDVAVFSSRNQCGRETLASAASLHAVVNPTIGVEKLDVEAASELGIIVGNGATPENYLGMAESAVMLMLNLMYGLRKSEEVLRGERPRPALENLHARSLRGATIGLVGLGNIGRTVARLLEPFGARVIAYSPRLAASDLPPGVTLVELETLMRDSDMVGVFFAVRPDNKALISESMLKLMKPSAYIVNVARGEAIDEDALTVALQEGRIAGAALDTFVVEPLPMDSPLRRLPNVILTPHLVGQTRDAYIACYEALLDNIGRVLRGELPRYCKNAHAEPRWRDRRRALGPAYELPANVRV